jgi:hypothetical protein
MRLDPLIDRAEYNTLLHFEELFSPAVAAVS